VLVFVAFSPSQLPFFFPLSRSRTSQTSHGLLTPPSSTPSSSSTPMRPLARTPRTASGSTGTQHVPSSVDLCFFFLQVCGQHPRHRHQQGRSRQGLQLYCFEIVANTLCPAGVRRFRPPAQQRSPSLCLRAVRAHAQGRRLGCPRRTQHERQAPRSLQSRQVCGSQEPGQPRCRELLPGAKK